MRSLRWTLRAWWAWSKVKEIGSCKLVGKAGDGRRKPNVKTNRIELEIEVRKTRKMVGICGYAQEEIKIGEGIRRAILSIG